MNIQLSSGSDEWHTPGYIVEAVSDVLGGIDLDPASSVEANKVVGASRFLTREDNALVCLWNCAGRSVYLNPPGGKIGNKSMSGLFWYRLMEHRKHFSHAIYMGFSLEQLQTTQRYHSDSILDFSFCVPSKRIRFLSPNDKSKNAPSHSNVIVYIPGSVDKNALFADTFKKFGKVVLRK